MQKQREQQEKLSDRAIIGILNSRKGVFCLLILTISTIALFLRFLDSASFAATVSVIGSIFMYSHSRTDIASMNANLVVPSTSPATGIPDNVVIPAAAPNTSAMM